MPFFYGRNMSNYPKYLLSSPIAASGDKTILPATAMEAGTGRMSQAEGWGQWNATPIIEGGIPPKREDANGAFYLLSQLLFWYQQGGLMNYTSTIAYEPGNEVLSAGVKYRCLVANGPGTDAGVVAPSANKTVWKNLDLPSVLAGQVTPFYNCTLGGSDGRRLIPWGSSSAEESYILCDGGSDGSSGNVPNLMDRFILGGTVEQSGQTGGSLSLQIPSVSLNATVGKTTLTVDQIPQHTHTGSTNSAGSHNHTRGTMNITGTFTQAAYGAAAQENTTGAFYIDGTVGPACNESDSRPKTFFDASRSWSGSTSSNGSHTHTMTLSQTGGGQPHTHTLTGTSTQQQVRLDRPPFYRLAYFVKIPE